jgi:hypothetical protein
MRRRVTVLIFICFTFVAGVAGATDIHIRQFGRLRRRA